MPTLPLKTPPGPDGVFILPESETAHWIKVRRLKPGSLFEVLLPDGRRAMAKILGGSRPRRGMIQNYQTGLAPAPLPAHLGVGLVRPAPLEWLVEKATEMGLRTLSPLYCQRSKFNPRAPYSEQKLARLKKISLETEKQCQRVTSLEVRDPRPLARWLGETEGPGLRIFLDETSEKPRLGPVFFEKKYPEYFFLVGPEGGFAPAERQLILKNNFQPVSLGPKRLKTETAALYVLALLDGCRRESDS